jgi:hypothetical protein
LIGSGCTHEGNDVFSPRVLTSDTGTFKPLEPRRNPECTPLYRSHTNHMRARHTACQGGGAATRSPAERLHSGSNPDLGFQGGIRQDSFLRRRSLIFDHCNSGHSGGDTPGPIPNPEVKPVNVWCGTEIREFSGTIMRCYYYPYYAHLF